MRVGDIFERLASGKKLKELSVEMGIDATTAQRRLKMLGYTWDNSKKVWEWSSDEEQPLDTDITTIGGRGQGAGKETSRSPRRVGDVTEISRKRDVKETTGKVKGDTREIFTAQEVLLLKRMMAEYKGVSEISKPKGNLHEQIKEIDTTSRARKNVYLTKDTDEKLGKLAEQERVGRSELVELALIEFLERHGS